MNKILLIVNSDIGRKGTIGFRFGKIAEELKRQNIPFEIIARANYSHFEIKTPIYKNYLARFFNGLRIYFLPFLDFRPLDIWFFERFVLKILKKSKLDFELAHFGEYLPKSIKYLKEKNTKIFLDIPIGHHQYALYLKEKGFKLDDDVGPVPKYLNQAIELADVLIVPSEFVRKTLEMAGFKDKKIEIVPFGVDMPRKMITKKQDTITNNQIPRTKLQDAITKKQETITKKIRFIFAGNVNYRKGVNFLLEAWNKLNLENAELLICGRVYRSIKKEIKKYKNEKVKFLGFVNLDKYFQEADVFVFPTLLEGSAKVVYEAMSYGLPVITTENAGSIVEDGKSGFIVPIGDVNALAEKMLYFYKNPQNIFEMGRNAYEQVKNYSWENYALKVLNIYKKYE